VDRALGAGVNGSTACAACSTRGWAADASNAGITAMRHDGSAAAANGSATSAAKAHVHTAARMDAERRAANADAPHASAVKTNARSRTSSPNERADDDMTISLP
jgi:hypothetical protein